MVGQIVGWFRGKQPDSRQAMLELKVIDMLAEELADADQDEDVEGGKAKNWGKGRDKTG
jgi:hypothetical protein